MSGETFNILVCVHLRQASRGPGNNGCPSREVAGGHGAGKLNSHYMSFCTTQSNCSPCLCITLCIIFIYVFSQSVNNYFRSISYEEEAMMQRKIPESWGCPLGFGFGISCSIPSGSQVRPLPSVDHLLFS